MPVVPALRRLGSEGQHGLHTLFQVHLGYGVCQLQNKKTWKRRTYWKEFSGADKEMRRRRRCSNITSLCDGCFLSHPQCPSKLSMQAEWKSWHPPWNAFLNTTEVFKSLASAVPCNPSWKTSPRAVTVSPSFETPHDREFVLSPYLNNSKV